MTEHQQTILNLSQFHSRFYNIKKIRFLYHFLIHLCKDPQIPSNTTTDKVHNWKNTVRYTYLQYSHTLDH